MNKKIETRTLKFPSFRTKSQVNQTNKQHDKSFQKWQHVKSLLFAWKHGKMKMEILKKINDPDQNYEADRENENDGRTY